LILVAENLSKAYRQVQAVDNVSLQIGAGGTYTMSYYSATHAPRGEFS